MALHQLCVDIDLAWRIAQGGAYTAKHGDVRERICPVGAALAAKFAAKPFLQKHRPSCNRQLGQGH